MYNIEEFGAIGDGKTLSTKSIQDAIDACSGAGGGMVYVPAGEFLTGPVFLKSNINFHISEGATLLGDTVISRYPWIQGRWEGIERKTYASILTGHDLLNVSITGRGTIDARGRVWWDAFMETRRIREEHGIKEREPDNPPEAPLKWPRPRVINLFNCKNVLIRDITIINSPSCTIHPVYCTNVTVDNVTVVNPPDSPNTDGINFDSSNDSKIVNCYIDVGDDCITLKSGYNRDGRRVGIPCENIVISNCVMVHGHGGVVIGSEMSGDVRNVTINNCVFDQTHRGLRIKAARGRGGIVEHIRASNIVMRGIGTAFTLSMFYQDWKGSLTLDGFYKGSGIKIEDVSEETPIFRNIHFSNISVSDADVVAEIRGLPEMPVQDINFANIEVTSSDEGMMVYQVRGILLDNVVVNSRYSPALIAREIEDVEIERFTDPDPNSDIPVIQFEEVSNVMIQNCSAKPGTGIFLEMVKGTVDNVIFRDNRLSAAKKDRKTEGKLIPYNLVPYVEIRETLRKELGYDFKILEVKVEKGEIYKIKVLTNNQKKELTVKRDGTLAED
jgi:polygalacturonase